MGSVENGIFARNYAVLAVERSVEKKVLFSRLIHTLHTLHTTRIASTIRIHNLWITYVSLSKEWESCSSAVSSAHALFDILNHGGERAVVDDHLLDSFAGVDRRRVVVFIEQCADSLIRNAQHIVAKIHRNLSR